MADRIGTVGGPFLSPGTSKNRRLYSEEAIAKAVVRMKDRLADPDGRPITMRTHHGAGDDSTRIAARVTEVKLAPDGTVTYQADIANTAAGKDIVALTSPENPYLRNVSLRGAFLGPVRNVMVDGVRCETADDLEIDGIDFTATPGIEQTVISAATAETDDRHPIFESCEDPIVTTEASKGNDDMDEAKSKDYANTKASKYADPGYQKDGKKRYALDTKGQVKAAWSYINQKANADKYSSGDLAKVKANIKAAAKRIGIKTEESLEDLSDVPGVQYLVEHQAAAEAFHGGTGYAEDGEPTGMYYPDGMYHPLIPVDPDGDGDVDFLVCPNCCSTMPGPEGSDTDRDNGMESATETRETGMTESNTAGKAGTEGATEETDARVTLSDAQLDRLGAAIGASMRPQAAETAAGDKAGTEGGTSTQENHDEGKPLSESVSEAITEGLKAVEERLTESVKGEVSTQVRELAQELVVRGLGPRRRGLVPQTQTTESADGSGDGTPAPEQKPLHKMTDEEFRAHRNTLSDHFIPAALR